MLIMIILNDVRSYQMRSTFALLSYRFQTVLWVFVKIVGKIMKYSHYISHGGNGDGVVGFAWIITSTRAPSHTVHSPYKECPKAPRGRFFPLASSGAETLKKSFSLEKSFGPRVAWVVLGVNECYLFLQQGMNVGAQSETAAWRQSVAYHIWQYHNYNTSLETLTLLLHKLVYTRYFT